MSPNLGKATLTFTYLYVLSKFYYLFLSASCPQCFDTVGQHEGHPACKKWGDYGGDHWLVRMEWHPAGWSV